MPAFVVAVEYRGVDTAPPGRNSRIGLREHAYDLQSATFAGHLSTPAPRVAFPVEQRSWNTDPKLPRCTACTAAVETVLLSIISTALL